MASQLRQRVATVAAGNEELMLVTDVTSPVNFAVQIVCEQFQMFSVQLTDEYNRCAEKDYR